MSHNPHRIGWLAGAYAAFVPLVLIGEIAFLIVGPADVLSRVLLDPRFARVMLGVSAAMLLIELLGGALVLKQQRARPRHTYGRGRLSCAASGGVLNAVGEIVLAVVYAQPEVRRMLEAELGFVTPQQLLPWMIAGAALAGAGRLLSLGGSISAWWLIQVETRKRLWIAIDVVLVIAAGVAWLKLPAQPIAGVPHSLELAVVRHALTTFAAIRMIIRGLPPLLTFIERSGYMSLVAARHLRSKKSGFLAVISLLSVFAVTVSCTALTTTLSVMGGFRNDLKRKILGNNAHIVIDRENAHIEGWRPMLEKVDHVSAVNGISPFVSGEVMLSSASNLATAVLRGIDTQRIGKVNDLPRNLTSGKLEYLDDPNKLLQLPPPGMSKPLLLGNGKLTRVGEDGVHDEAKSTHGDGGTDNTQDAGVAAATASGKAPGAAKKPETGAEDKADFEKKKLDLEKRLDTLEAFLRDADRPKHAEEDRQLLPGIIIGQELARALRLYVGDEVNVVAPLGALGPSGPMPKSRPFRVAGIFYSGMYEYDMKFTYVALGTAQKFLNVGDTISGFEVRVGDIERAPITAGEIRAKLGDKSLRVRDWQELNSRLFGALALEKLAMFVALGIAILVASFCIAGTLTLMVQEKGREVAILKAMGTSDRSVVGVFVIEGGLIGVLGAALGLFLGYMLCFAAEHFGIRMNPEVYYIDRLPVHVDPTEFALTGVAAVLVCLVITIYPALLASRLRPVEALRYE